jgi:hypothetical protein
MSPRSLARSKTLPRHFEGPPLRSIELDDLPVDSNKLVQMQRWVLGLVLGKYTFGCVIENPLTRVSNFS